MQGKVISARVELSKGSMLRIGNVMYCRHNVVVNCSFLWKKGSEEQEKELKLRFPKLDIRLAKGLDPKMRAIAMRQRVHLVHGTMDSRWWKAHPSRQAHCLFVFIFIFGEWFLGFYLHLIRCGV